VTAGGRVVVNDSANGTTVVDLPLELVLGKVPQKVRSIPGVRLWLFSSTGYSLLQSGTTHPGQFVVIDHAQEPRSSP
jgi:hypothetical protein